MLLAELEFERGLKNDADHHDWWTSLCGRFTLCNSRLRKHFFLGRTKRFVVRLYDKPGKNRVCITAPQSRNSRFTVDGIPETFLMASWNFLMRQRGEEKVIFAALFVE